MTKIVTRQSSAKRGYGSRWQTARLTYLRTHPLCTECQRSGRLTPATVVDHVEPHKGDQSKFWNHDNWQSLCAHHHNLKTAKEDGAFGNKPSNKPSKECGLDGTPLDKKHHWNK